MYLLDTNTVSSFLDQRRYSPQLTQKILSTPPEQLFITVITVEEILRGALAAIQKQRQNSSITITYRYFEELFFALHHFQVLSYTTEAEDIYQALPASAKRVGTQDCRIAAIACSRHYVVVTANVADFVAIGIVDVENWL
jgi:predicted nucleic acid-binding protein